MSQINIFNYEGFYLELIEGTISIENKALLLDFLSKNPNLVEPEFDYALPSADFNTTPEFKESLKIHDESEIISEHNIEWFIWAKMEGILSSPSIVRLKRYLDEKPSLYRLVVDFQETILPTERHIFTDKKSLKRGKKVAIWPIVSTAAAAILAMVLLGDMFFNPKDGIQTETASETTNSVSEDDNLIESIVESVSNPVADVNTVGISNPVVKIKKEETISVQKNIQVEKNTSSEKDELNPTEVIPEENTANLLAENTAGETQENLPETESLDSETQNDAPVEVIPTVEPTPTTNNITPASDKKRKFKLRIGKFGVTKK